MQSHFTIWLFSVTSACLQSLVANLARPIRQNKKSQEQGQGNPAYWCLDTCVTKKTGIQHVNLEDRDMQKLVTLATNTEPGSVASSRNPLYWRPVSGRQEESGSAPSDWETGLGKRSCLQTPQTWGNKATRLKTGSIWRTSSSALNTTKFMKIMQSDTAV